MDITVTPDPDGKTSWNLTDLLGRSMGHIAENEGKFTVHPANNAIETMAGLPVGPHGSLDAALAHIERLTRGVCRMAES